MLPLLFLYPSATDDIEQLSTSARSIKVARHTPCSRCTCRGLHPPDSSMVVLDDSEDAQEALEQADQSEAPTDEGFWMVCDCTHGWDEHGAGMDVSTAEMTRRTKVAIRIDEILNDLGKLTDFEYSDEDIESLRKQMTLPPQESVRSSAEASSKGGRGHSRKHSQTSTSSLSEPAPESKRRRISSSSLSDQAESSDEDRPLASTTKVTGDGAGLSDQRAGKKQSSHMGVIQKIPRGEDPVKAKQSRTEVTVKSDEPKLDDGKINRLANGVTQDVSANGEEAPTEKPAVVEERKGLIRFAVVRNDGTPHNLIILTGLKNLFQKQLPKMPREYIARLVYDRNSEGMAVVRRGLQVVGGITYRPFPHRGFAEIVFFAIASHFQVNGYGGHLMNHFKTHIRKAYPSITHFLTYADNYAIGYFKKQGFSKEISLPRHVWVGYIKDYEGGTLMQCALVSKVDYLDTKNILTIQREAILTKIRQKSQSHVVYPGLEEFKNVPPGFEMDYRRVPGLRDSGWNPEMEELVRQPSRGPHFKAMQRLLVELQQHGAAWAFQHPVLKEDVPDYYDVIKKPMDFSTMEMKLNNNLYPTFSDFIDDANLVFSNCRSYNPEHTIYAKNAVKMEKFVREWVAAERSKNDGIDF
ncbi:histone acetyltransferase [Tulasnella sp. 419]|nr:histone acetyltransferase [Tulasnella sp. 418]KAG8970335.1 histone acetyltransferase [Tulasnella sp. 419]